MKKTLLHLIVTATLLGCSSSPSGDDQTLNLALETSPNKLDPAFVVDVAEGQICTMIFQRLVRFSPHGDVVPDAARSWEILDQGKRYVFHLDQRARFSDGQRLLSADVVASFSRILGPESTSPRKWVLDRIRGARDFSSGRVTAIGGLMADDDSTVVIELDEPFRPFLQLLGMPAASILQRDVALSAASDAATEMVGSGQWMLAAWERGDFLLLERNPHHPHPPMMEAIRFRIIPEAFTRIAEFESGSLDIFRIPHAELDRFLNDASRSDRIQSQPELRVAYIGLNNSRGPLADSRVRTALNMAVDVDQIIEVLTSGRGIRAAGSIPPTLAGFKKRTPVPYDPQQARRLLSEAGYPEGFAMDIWQRDSPEGNRLVEVAQGYLKQIGVEVQIVKREWSAFKEAVSQGKVDAFFLDWYADYPDAENFLFPLFHSSNAGGGGNRSFFNDPHIDELIEASQRTVDLDRGNQLYATVDSLIYLQAPWLYLYFPMTFVAVAPTVSGYVYPVLYLGEDFTSVRKSGEE